MFYNLTGRCWWYGSSERTLPTIIYCLFILYIEAEKSYDKKTCDRKKPEKYHCITEAGNR